MFPVAVEVHIVEYANGKPRIRKCWHIPGHDGLYIYRFDVGHDMPPFKGDVVARVGNRMACFFRNKSVSKPQNIVGQTTDEPPYVPSGELPRDPEPGLPAMSTVHASNISRAKKTRVVPQIKEDAHQAGATILQKLVSKAEAGHIVPHSTMTDEHLPSMGLTPEEVMAMRKGGWLVRANGGYEFSPQLQSKLERSVKRGKSDSASKTQRSGLKVLQKLVAKAESGHILPNSVMTDEHLPSMGFTPEEVMAMRDNGWLVKASGGGYKFSPQIQSKLAQSTKHVKESKSIAERLDAAFADIDNTDITTRLDAMLHAASSNRRFDSPNQLRHYLTEGALLSITAMASSIIGVPTGEYVVYNITPQRAMLVPTADITVQEDNFSRTPTAYDISISKLLSCWNKTEKVLAEDETPLDTDSNKTRIQQSKSKYPRRTKVKGAIEKWGGSQEELADNIGVDPSTISRWTAKDKQGGRIPTLKDAIALSDVTGAPIETMFGDVGKEKKRKATSGSGGGRNETYRKGTAE